MQKMKKWLTFIPLEFNWIFDLFSFDKNWNLNIPITMHLSTLLTSITSRRNPLESFDGLTKLKGYITYP